MAIMHQVLKAVALTQSVHITQHPPLAVPLMKIMTINTLSTSLTLQVSPSNEDWTNKYPQKAGKSENLVCPGPPIFKNNC